MGMSVQAADSLQNHVICFKNKFQQRSFFILRPTLYRKIKCRFTPCYTPTSTTSYRKNESVRFLKQISYDTIKRVIWVHFLLMTFYEHISEKHISYQ